MLMVEGCSCRTDWGQRRGRRGEEEERKAVAALMSSRVKCTRITAVYTTCVCAGKKKWRVREGGARTPHLYGYLSRSSSSSTACFASIKGNAVAVKVRDELLELIANTRRGLALNDEESRTIKEEAFRLAETLRTCGQGSQSADFVNDTWRLLFTTEKETLFILKSFPTKDTLQIEQGDTEGDGCNSVYQVIQLDEDGRGLLNNVIEFGSSSRAFIVNSKIRAVQDGENGSGIGSSRIEFQFTGAKLRWSDNLTIPLPPFGAGWFDSIYVDDRYRVALDSRYALSH